MKTFNILNQIVLSVEKDLSGEVINLVLTEDVPREKRQAFEQMVEGMTVFAEYIFELSENKSKPFSQQKRLFKRFINECEKLYEKM